MVRFLVPALVVASLAFVGASVVAQETPPQPGPQPGPQSTPQSTSTSDDTGATTPKPSVALAALLESIQRKRDELAAVRTQQSTGDKSEAERKAFAEQAAKLTAELDRLRQSFESVATGIDVAEFEETKSDKFDLQAELQQLVEPAIAALKDLTEKPRAVQNLKSTISGLEEREKQINEALAHIETLLADAEEGPLRSRLLESRARWVKERTDARNRATVERFRLKKLEAEDKGFWEGVQDDSDRFVRGVGFTIVLAVAAFLAVFFGLRAARRGVRRVLRRREGRKRSTYSRVFDVLYELIVLVLAVLAVFIVLIVRGDWVLLGLAVLVLLLIAWASKQFLPGFVEQIRFVLNLGTVREDERVIYNGLPWHVTRLNFYTRLTNPRLTGGLIRLSVTELMSMHSRPTSDREGWFPTEEGDWVLMPDGLHGKVLLQTPEIVQLQAVGGLVHTYPAADFLAAPPANLSGGFRCGSTFGIDYGLQAIATSDVPKRFTAFLKAALEEQFDPAWLVKTNVEFAAAGSSSLDYRALVDFNGDAAKDYAKIGRAIQRALVDACNENDWNIPFPQLTVHRADPDS